MASALQAHKPRSAPAAAGGSSMLQAAAGSGPNGLVPHYNVFGHQHHKLPFMDLAFFGAERDTNYWKNACPWGKRS